MSTDRELLELAAKAAGYTTNHPWNAERLTLKPPVDALCVMNKNCVVHTAWNPLDDSGAALNLAVKLGIEIIPDREVEEVSTAFCVYHPRLIGYNTVEPFGIDEMAATRRAIVRAAAEIGKAMP